MEKENLNISIASRFLGKTSSRDKKTDFYGMMYEVNHKTPNGYNFLHNPDSSNTSDMDLAYVDMGEIRHIFEDDILESLKAGAKEITILLFNNTHLFIDFNIPNVSTEKCRCGVAITMSSMYVGKFEYGREQNHFTGNHYDSKATVGTVEEEIYLVPFFFPCSIVYQRHDWKTNPNNSCIIKIRSNDFLSRFLKWR